MKKKNWYKKNITAQRPINELYDLFDDEETIGDYNKVMTPTVVDFDALERERVGIPTIREDEVEDFLADKHDDEQPDVSFLDEEMEFMDEVEAPLEITEEEIPEFGSTQEAMQWAIDNDRVVRINYKTQGQQGRATSRGLKLKREVGLAPGSDITRIVEPHHMFVAGTGNLLLVTYDRSVRAIRAYIVPNVLNYIFTGKKFKQRLRVLPSSPDKRKITMNVNIFENLKNIGDELESKGLSKTASTVTSAMSDLLNIKTAEYLGPQGYWIRQTRCWDNCYRKKRADTGKPAQEVWQDCWKEYLEDIKDNNSGWQAYAQTDTELFKYASDKQRDWVKKANKKFAEDVEAKMKSGFSQGESIYAILREKNEEHKDILIASAEKLSKVAKALHDQKYLKLASQIANTSIELLKEADFADPEAKPRNFIQRGLDWMSGKNKPAKQPSKQEIIQRLQSILKAIEQMTTTMRSRGRQPVAYNYSKMNKEAAPLKTQQEIALEKANKMQPTAAPASVAPTAAPTDNPAGSKLMDLSKMPTQAPQAPQAAPQKPLQQYQIDTRQNFNTFVQNLRQEVSSLTGFAGMADQNTRPLLQNAIIAAQNFLQQNDQMQTQGKGQWTYQAMAPIIQELNTSIVNAIAGIEKVPETTAEPAEVAKPGEVAKSPAEALQQNQTTFTIQDVIGGLSTLSPQEFQELYKNVINHKKQLDASLQTGTKPPLAQAV